MDQYNISLRDVMSLMHEDGGVEYFEKVRFIFSIINYYVNYLILLLFQITKNRNPHHVVNWIIHDLYGLLNFNNIKFNHNPVTTQQLGSIIDSIEMGDISGISKIEIFFRIKY